MVRETNSGFKLEAPAGGFSFDPQVRCSQTPTQTLGIRCNAQGNVNGTLAKLESKAKMEFDRNLWILGLAYDSWSGQTANALWIASLLRRVP